MLTPWGEKLDKDNILQEYPRPQLRRDSYLNLNGEWEYCVSESADEPAEFPETILVPFSPESELSGDVTCPRKCDYIWYRRRFSLPEGFNRGRVLLHFGAVDQSATVFVNGRELMSHVGGFTPFSVDIT
ncbi:MAG: glycoside hydrolase family 2, partial [Clostridia bacterium]|nr:glycoside hydrolase family 2 [Clostridia bacterium]